MVAFLNARCVAGLQGFRVKATIRGPEEITSLPELSETNLFLVELNTLSGTPDEAVDFLLSWGVIGNSILVTSVNRKNIVNRCLQKGVADYIFKPFTTERLREGLFRFQERQRFLLDLPENCHQADIDRHWRTHDFPSPCENLPKGIQKETVQLFLDALSESPNSLFIEELSDLTGLSRPTVWRYMEFLAETGKVRGTIVYRSKGRPLNCYQLL